MLFPLVKMKKRFAFELRRKFIHLLALLFLVVYLIFREYYGHGGGLLALVFILIFFLVLEYYRIARKKRIPLFHIFWRKSEKDKLGGNVYFILGTIIAFAAFDYWIAVVALLMTIFGDMAGALIGIPFGKHKLKKPNKKSWEGTIAQFLVDLVIGFILLDSILIVVGMALAATIVETKFEHVNDNMSIPVISGFVGQILSFI